MAFSPTVSTLSGILKTVSGLPEAYRISVFPSDEYRFPSMERKLLLDPFTENPVRSRQKENTSSPISDRLSGMSTVFNLLQTLNARSSMETVPSGRVMLSKEVQPLKALRWIFFSPLDRVTEVSAVQFLNACSQTSVMPSGRVTVLSEVQSRNVPSFSCLTPWGTVILSSPVQPKKAQFPR